MDIRAASYDCQIQSNKILSVKLLDGCRKIIFTEAMEIAEKFLIGHFRRGKETGKHDVLYKEETPIIEIQLEDMIVFWIIKKIKKRDQRRGVWYDYARETILLINFSRWKAAAWFENDFILLIRMKVEKKSICSKSVSLREWRIWKAAPECYERERVRERDDVVITGISNQR